MPSKQSLIPAFNNPDLEKERKGASFNITEFQEWWHEGADKLKEKREIEDYLLKDINDTISQEYLSWEDTYTAIVKQVTESSQKMRLLQKIRNPGGNELWPGLFNTSTVITGISPNNNPFTTHLSMYVDVVRGQGTPEQFEKFGKPGENCNIIGTYAQTELSHGTHVRGLQTRADFDRQTDEFVLNTPTLESYKFWPGGLGHTANHAMVVAQLYIDGVHKGIQMFIVPIRDRETHMPLPGIDVGELGKKVGMSGTNQGFLGLKNVRIPRENMLMRNAKVARDGTFTESPASRLNYMTMVYTRCLIVKLCASFLLEAATISSRYSAVRRQSPINPNDPEPQIIDHITQQYKLFPEIASGMALYIATKYMWNLYDQTLIECSKGEYGRLQENHILSSSLKVLSTIDACAGIERLRQACGGHGYLAASNFCRMYGNAVAAYTYEGENTVLLLQIGKFLMKCWLRLSEGKKNSTFVAYLEEAKHKPPQWQNNWDYIVKILQYTAAKKSQIAFENLSKRIANGQTEGEAANNTGIELVKAAELHSRQFVASTFLNFVRGSDTASLSKSLKNVVENLLELYLVHTALQAMDEILRFVPIIDEQLRTLEKRLEIVLNKIRPDAIAICDGFDFHDRILNSVLGYYDGNVYEHIYESAQKSPLNQKKVPAAFELYMKPFFKSNM